MIEYTLMNVLILELKIYCGPDKFYGRSKFGQYDDVKDRAPSVFCAYIWITQVCSKSCIYGEQGPNNLKFS